jgi:hypothetical protein
MREPQTGYLKEAQAAAAALLRWRDEVADALGTALLEPELRRSRGRKPLPPLGSAASGAFAETLAAIHLLADPSLRLVIGSLVAKVSVASGVPRGDAIAAGFEVGPGPVAVLELLSRCDHGLATKMAGEAPGHLTACDLVAAAVLQELWPGSCLRVTDRDAIDVARCLILRCELPSAAWPDHQGVRGLLEHPWFRGARRRSARSCARALAQQGTVSWEHALTWEHASTPPDGLVAMGIELWSVAGRARCAKDLLRAIRARVDDLVLRADSSALSFWWDQATAAGSGAALDADAGLQQSRGRQRRLPLRHTLPSR